MTFNCLLIFSISSFAYSSSFASDIVPVVPWAVWYLREQVLLGCCHNQQLSAEQLCPLLSAVLLCSTPELNLGWFCGPCSQCCHPVPHSSRKAPGPLWHRLPESPCKADPTRVLKRKERRKSHLVTPHTPWYKYHSASENKITVLYSCP